mmetsp:Transcript_68106/g.188487  ORF Transcript_68106/g.188487 Transcript_68106/m.188487 type:complete len:228 (-) Transcript_68106:33-716(-)
MAPLLVHLHLAARCLPIRGELPREHAPAVAVLLPAAPRHEEPSLRRNARHNSRLGSAIPLRAVGAHCLGHVAERFDDADPDVAAQGPDNGRGAPSQAHGTGKATLAGLAPEVPRGVDLHRQALEVAIAAESLQRNRASVLEDQRDAVAVRRWNGPRCVVGRGAPRHLEDAVQRGRGRKGRDPRDKGHECLPHPGQLRQPAWHYRVGDTEGEACTEPCSFPNSLRRNA